MQTRIATEGNWLTNSSTTPIGEWQWFTRIDAPDSADLSYITEIDDNTKQMQEAEQEEWRNNQEEISE